MSSIVSRLSTAALLIGFGASTAAFAQSEQPAADPVAAPAVEAPADPAVDAPAAVETPAAEDQAGTETAPETLAPVAAPSEPAAAPAAPADPAAAAVPAQESKPFDPIVATVNGKEIRRSDLEAVRDTIPQARSMPLETIYQPLLDRLITMELMVTKAREEKLQETPLVQKRLALAEDQILSGTYIDQELEKGITDAMMKERYDQEVAKLPPMEEMRAHHILVASKKEADAVIKELNKKKGKSFEDLAKTKSTDNGSKEQGGDLGYFSLSDMVPEFSEAVKEMKPGETTKTPVKTQFGWHVVRVDDRRPVAPPTYDEVKDQIRSMLSQEKTTQIINTLKANAKIVEYNLDGSPKQ